MTQPQILEGTPEQLAVQVRALPKTVKYRITITPDEENSHQAVSDAPEETAYSLEAAITRLNSRSPEEIEAARQRILNATPPPKTLPAGKTLADVIMGQWPGDESDEQIKEALRKLS